MPLPFAPLGGSRRTGANLPFAAPVSQFSAQRLAAAGLTEFAPAAKIEADVQYNQMRSQKLAFDMEQDMRTERRQRRDNRQKAQQKAVEQAASLNVAKAEFGLATAPKTITDSERNRLEEDFTKTRSQIAAEAAAALAAETLADPVANETEGGFLGFGAEPTAAALEKQKAAERFQDPTKLTDDDLNTYRTKNPASFAKFDDLKGKLDEDQKARDARAGAEFGVAVAKARKAGFDPLAGAPAGEDPAASLDRVQTEVEQGTARIAELQEKARSGAPLGELTPVLEELTTLQSEVGRKSQLLETGRAALDAQRRAAQVSQQSARETAIKEPSLPQISPDEAKRAAITNPDGSYETTQPENLAALAKDGAKVFWRQDGATSTATPETRAAKAAEAAGLISELKTAAQAKTSKVSAERDRLQGLVDRGEMSPEHANAALDALLDGEDKDLDGSASVVNRKLDSAVQDFMDGQIDAKTLDAALNAAGSASTAAEVAAEASRQRKAEDEHIKALRAKMEGDPNDPVLSGEALKLSKRIRDVENPGFLQKWGGWLKATPIGLTLGAISDTIKAGEWLADPSLWGKEEVEKAAILKTRLQELRQQSRAVLVDDLTKRGVDLADQPRLIAKAQLEAARDAGVFETAAARGGIPQAIGEKLPFVGAILEADRLLPFAETAYKMEAGEEVDADEMEAFSEFIRFAGNDQAFFTKFIDGVAALPAYIVELASTSGIASAVRVGGTKALKEAIMFAATKEGKERLVKASAEAVAKKFGKDHAKKYAAWRIGSGLAQEAVRLPVASSGRIAANFTQEAARDGVQLSAGEQGIVAMMDREGRKGNWERFAASTVDSLIENVSERSGGYLAKLIPAGVRQSVAKMSQQAKGKLLSAALVKSLVAANPGKPVGQIGKFLKGANIGGTFEEMGEERVGSLLRDIYNNTSEHGLDVSKWGLTIPTAEDLALEMLTFTVPGAARGIQTNRHFSKLDNSLRASDSEFTARLDSLYQSPEAEADRITEKIGTPVEADDLTNATALVGKFEDADAVKAVDRLSLDLMERSEKALAGGDLEKASRLRQRALQVNRSKGDLLDDEVIRAVGATKEISGLRDAAIQTRAQVEAMPDADPNKKQALVQVEKMDREADLAGALVKIAQAREGLLTTAEQEAIKPVKGEKPPVVNENGAYIITDAGIATLRNVAPTAATFVKDDETTRRQKLLSQTAAAAQSTPPASSPVAGSPVVGGSSPQAGAAPTASSGAGVAQGAATATPAGAAPVNFQSVPAGKGSVSVDPDGSIRVKWQNQDVDSTALLKEAASKGLIATISGSSGSGGSMTNEMVFKPGAGAAPALLNADESALQASLEVILRENNASTQILQRRLGYGYQQASRIIDLLEQRGFIGPAVNTSSQRQILVNTQRPTLPNDLQGAKPRYSYGSNQFELEFESDFDKAAYIAAQVTPSKRDADYVSWAVQTSGMTPEQVRDHGKKVREQIKGVAKGQTTSGRMVIPAQPITPPASTPTQGNPPSQSSPTSSKPAADKTKTAREWRNETRKGVVDKIRDPKTKGKVARVVDAVADAFDKRGALPPGGIALTDKEGGSGVSYNPITKTIEVNVKVLNTQANNEKAGALTDDQLADWLDRIASEELTHFATVEAISPAESADAWKKLGKSKAGKKLQEDALRAYNAAYEQAGKQAPALNDAAAYYELVRMAIQNTEFRQRITEAAFAEPGIKADLLAFLQRIADILSQRIAALPKAARAALEGDLAKVKASMDALGIVTDSGQQAPAEVVVGPQPSSDTGTPAADPGQAAAGNSALVVVQLKDGRAFHVRKKELDATGDTLRAFTWDGKPIKGDAGAIPRNLIVAETVTQPASTQDSNSLSQAASAVYQSILDKYPPPNDYVGEWHKQLVELVANPSRFHPVVQETNKKGIVIGDTVSVPLLDGIKVVSVGRQGASMMVRIAPPMPGVYGGWYKIDQVTKQDVASIDVAANEAATSPENTKPEPTDAQKKAGNYEMGHVKIGGMDITIENPVGSIRSGTDKDGERWEVTMAHHYGYLKGTKGKDGDHIDIFIEEGTPEDYSGPVYVVNQMRPVNLTVQPLGGGAASNVSAGMGFDEHKAVMGPSIKNAAQARAAYLANYSPGWSGDGSIAYFPNVDLFKKWASASQRRAPAKTPIMSEKKAAENTGAFDSDSFESSRAERIKQSKATGNRHLDSVIPSVETMRGREIFYVHNPSQRGVIRTVDNNRNVYVHWSDAESAEKEMASEIVEDNASWLKASRKLPILRTVRGGKTYVMQSTLGPSDMQDYVFADKKQDTETVNPAQSSTPTPESSGVADAPKVDTPAVEVIDANADTEAFIDRETVKYSEFHQARVREDHQKRMQQSGRTETEADRALLERSLAEWSVDRIRPRVAGFVSEIDGKDVGSLVTKNNGMWPAFWRLFEARTGGRKLPKTQKGIEVAIRAHVGEPAYNEYKERVANAQKDKDDADAVARRARILEGARRDAAAIKIAGGEFADGAEFAEKSLRDGWRVRRVGTGAVPQYKLGNSEGKFYKTGKNWKPIIDYARLLQEDMPEPAEETTPPASVAETNESEGQPNLSSTGETQAATFNPFDRGDRVTWESEGKTLTGTIRSVSSDGTADINTDQIALVGGVPIKRIETVSVRRLSRISETAQKDTPPPAGASKPAVSEQLGSSKPERFSASAKEEARQQFDGLFAATRPISIDRSGSNDQIPPNEDGIDSPAQLANYDELPDEQLEQEELTALRALRDRFGSGVFAAHPRQPLLASTQTPREKESRRGALSEFRKLSEELYTVFGKRVLFVQRRGKPLPDNGYNLGVSRNVLAVDIDAAEPVSYLLGHELGHAIESQSPVLYGELSAALLEMAGDSTDYRARLTALGYKKGELDAEIINDFIGSQFMEPAFWRDLSGRDKSLFERMASAAINFIQSILRKAAFLSRDARPLFSEIDKARAVLVDVLTRYASDRNFPQQGALSGQLSRSSSGFKQQAIPADRLPGFIKLAQTLIAEGVQAPQDLAAFLEETFPGGKARPFSQALWNAVGMVSPDLSSTPDWASIYSEIDGTNEEEAEETTDTETDPIRDLILSQDNRAKKAHAMKKLSEERGETLKQTQEFVEAKLVQIADEVARNGESPQDQFDELVSIYEKQPLFSSRTSTSMENQAYSTPAPMAFALRHMTGVTPQTSVYDATAGNGMLEIGADLGNSVANEIDETRRAGLTQLGVGTITSKDATSPVGVFAGRERAQVVHLNPPFGSIPNVNFEGFGIRKLEHIISLHALKEGMADNGTAAIILGATMKNQEQVKGGQWVFENYLYANYHVVDNFEVSGELYGNQGAKWPVRILVIAGRRAVPLANQDLAPKTVDRLETWDDVWARAERTRDEVKRQQDLGTDQRPAVSPDSPTGNADTENPRPIPDGQRSDDPTTQGGGRRGGSRGGQSNPGAAGTGGSGLAPGGPPVESQDTGTTDQPASGGRKPSPRMEGGSGRGPGGTADAGSGSAGDSTSPDATQSDQSNDRGVKRERKKAVATDTQIPYDPASTGNPFETLAPRGIGESLQAALAEIVANRGPIDQFVADSLDMSVADLQKAMSAEQIDGVAMAIYQMETGGALIIGDETGIGKGRQAASLIRYAILNGKIPVFFTKDPKLFSDMWGDLRDIGTQVTQPNPSPADLSVRPLVLGDAEKAQIKTPDNDVVLKPASNAKQRSVFAAARENGFAATGHNAIFATYSQIRDVNDRQEFLEWLAANDDVVVILDEAHESAGDGETSMQAAFMMGGTIQRGKGATRRQITKSGLLNGPGAMHPRGGALYLSATFAKRPDNMPVYYRTDLRRGADSFGQVVEAMVKGGVALQQAITEALAEAGQYTRRERDFTGISYDMKQVVVEDEEELVRQVDEVTSVLSSITSFSRRIKSAVEDATALSDSAQAMTDFASIVHNQVGQLLLAAKADAVVEEVVAAHRRGEKPIVALMNTMESFLQQYVTDNEIKPGQAINLNWSSLLEYALSRTLRASEKLPNGDTIITIIDPAEFGLDDAYDAVRQAARDIDVTFPVSPIDYIIQKAKASGVNVGELTGRESGIDYTDFQTGAGTYRKFKKADKNTLVNTFNGGTLDGLLLNASGSTGLSIHASEKFKDQKPRHMIIAQPALDINVFIQTLGRIKRTGIVLLGKYPDGSAYGARYSHLTLPLNSELRPAIMAARKMKSLNANTTGESDSAVKIEAEDLMNRFGNLAVAEYLNRNSDLALELGLSVTEKEDGTVEVPADIARKFTGRMALQTNQLQGEAYAEIIADYRRAVEQAKVTGDYDLEIIIHEDWDATKEAAEQIIAGTDESSIFTSSVNVEVWEMTDNRPTPSGEDMREEFIDENGSSEALDARWKAFAEEVNSRLDATEQRLTTRLAEANAKLAGLNENDPDFKATSFEVAQTSRNLVAIGVKKSRWRDTERRLDDLIDEAGKPVNIENAETGELDQGMMTQIKFPDITSTLRIAPSAFRMTYLLNRPGGRAYLSLANFKADGYSQSRSYDSLSDIKGDRGGRRERRTMLVGSPIRAFGATGGRGKVVRFKSRDGELVTGIMMPRGWRITDLAEDPRRELADANAVGRYLENLGWTAGFVESGESVRIHVSSRSFYITAPPARRTGATIFLDPELRAIVGDFRKAGNRMRADRINSVEDVVRVAARVAQITGKRFRGQDVARVRRANGLDETADDSATSGSRGKRPKSEAKQAATEAWNNHIGKPLQSAPRVAPSAQELESYRNRSYLGDIESELWGLDPEWNRKVEVNPDTGVIEWTDRKLPSIEIQRLISEFNEIVAKVGPLPKGGYFPPTQLNLLPGSVAALQSAARPVPTGESSDDPAVMALQTLSEVDELFRYPVATGTRSLTKIMGLVFPGSRYLGDATREDEDRESGAESRSMFATPNNKEFYVYEKGDDVWIDVSRLEEGDVGSAIYAAVGNYAFNADKTFIGDPAGLSEKAIVRRTSHMLSLALRYGTTRHIAPAKEQIDGVPEKGIAPLRMTGNYQQQVRGLIDSFLATSRNLNKETNDATYDFDTGVFQDAQGRVDSAGANLNGRGVGVEELPLQGRPEDGQGNIGRARFSKATDRRVVFLKSLVSAPREEQSRLLENFRRWGRAYVKDGGLTGIFSAPRLGIDDPDFIEALDYLNDQLPSEEEREDLLNRAGFDWGRDYTEDELRQAATGVRYGLRSEYDERLDRETHAAWNAEASALLRSNRSGVIRDLVATAAAGEAIINPVQVKASQLLLPSLTMRALAAGDRQAMRDAEALTWAYDIAGTETARGLAARWQPHKTPEEIHRELLAKAIFTPSAADRERAKKAPTPTGKRRRIAQLEAEIEKVRTEAMARERSLLEQVSGWTSEARQRLATLRKESTREIKALREQLATLQAEKDSLQILAEANDKRLKQIEEAFKEMGVTFNDLFVSKEAVVALRTSSMVKNVLAQFNEKERLVTKMRMEAKTDRHIAKKLNISKTAVEAINERFNVAFRAQAREWVKRGFSAADLDGSVDLGTLIDEKGNLLSAARPDLTDAEIDAKVDEIFRVIVPSEEARATGALKRMPAGAKEGEFGFDLSRPEHAAMLMRAIQRLDASGMDMVYEYWINGLLSGPATHIANLAGNTGNAAWEYAVQRPVEMLVNSIITRDAAGAQFGEIKSMAKYLSMAASTAARSAKIAWQTEVSLFETQWLNRPVSIGTTTGDKGQVQRFAIKGGKGRLIRMPSRALQFADEFAKHLFGMLEAAAQAHRLAKAEGLKGAEFDARVDRLVKTPGSPAWIAAVDKAHRITFTQDLPAPIQKMQDLLHDKAKTPWGAVIKTFLRFLFPFVRTPYNIFATGLRKTPLGTLRMAGKGIAAWRGSDPFFDSYPKAAIAADVAEQILAWTATMLLIGAAEGDPDDDEKTLLITGSRSMADNRGEDQMLSRMKGGETTILWKGKPIMHYGRYEPFATVITTVVDAARNMKAMGQGRAPKEAFDATWRGFLNQARSKTFLQGLEGLMSLIEGHKNLTDSAVKAVAQGVVWNLVRQPVRAADNYARDSRNAPWYYHAFPAGGLAEPLFDLYGRPVEKAGGPISRALISVPTKQAPIVPADRAMSRFNLENPNDAYFPQQPTKSMFRYKVPAPGLDAKGRPKAAWKDMTPQEAAAFRRRAGQQFSAAASIPFPFGSGTATPAQMAEIKSLRDKVQRETKETMFPGRAPAMPPRKSPSLAELFGQRLRQ